MTLKIERGVPVPPPRRRFYPEMDAAVASMSPGDSLELTFRVNAPSATDGILNYLSRRYPRGTFTARKTSAQTARVWRVK